MYWYQGTLLISYSLRYDFIYAKDIEKNVVTYHITLAVSLCIYFTLAVHDKSTATVLAHIIVSTFESFLLNNNPQLALTHLTIKYYTMYEVLCLPVLLNSTYKYIFSLYSEQQTHYCRRNKCYCLLCYILVQEKDTRYGHFSIPEQVKLPFPAVSQLNITEKHGKVLNILSFVWGFKVLKYAFSLE